jgi:transposase-like protein
VNSELAKYTAEEERAIREATNADGHAECPRCHVRMTHRAIGGGSFGLGYHRTREWLLCPSCKRSVLFDRKRGTRL